MPTVGLAMEVNKNLLISIPELKIESSCLNTSQVLQTFQSLSKLDHGRVPEQTKHIEVEEGGAGGEDEVGGGGDPIAAGGGQGL